MRLYRMTTSYRVYLADVDSHPSLNEDQWMELVESDDSNKIRHYWVCKEEFSSEDEAYAYAERYQSLFPLITTDDEDFYF